VNQEISIDHSMVFFTPQGTEKKKRRKQMRKVRRPWTGPFGEKRAGDTPDQHCVHKIAEEEVCSVRRVTSFPKGGRGTSTEHVASLGRVVNERKVPFFEGGLEWRSGGGQGLEDGEE